MKRYLGLLCGILLSTGSMWAEMVQVKLYQKPELNAEGYITQYYNGNQGNLGACWDGAKLQLNKSNETGSASLTFKAPNHTVILSYSFLVGKNDEKPTYQINGDPEVTPKSNMTNPEKVENNNYNRQQLKITTTVERKLGFLAWNYYYVRMKQFDFTLLIPEVQNGQQKNTIVLSKLTNTDLSSGTTTRSGELVFYVKDPISTTDASQYFSAQLVSNETDAADRWAIASSEWTVTETNKTDNGRKVYEVKVPITYNAGTANQEIGTFEATVRLSSKNDKNANIADQKAQITVGDVKAENPIAWGQNWGNNGNVTLYKGDSYGRSEYLVNTAGLALEIPTSSAPSVLYVDPLTGSITAKAEGDVVLTYTQPETDTYKEKVLTLYVKVIKRTPIFTINAEKKEGDKYILYVNKSYTDFVSSTNMDYATSVLSITHNADPYFVVNGRNAATKSNVATFDVTVAQAEGNLWYSKTETFTIELRHNPIHVGTLCSRTLEDLYNDDKFSIDKNNLTKLLNGEIYIGDPGKNTAGGSIKFHFAGSPDKLDITTATANGNPTWQFLQSKTEYDNDFYALKNNTFDKDAQYLKIVVSGTQAQGKITSLCITERVGLSVSPTDISLSAIDNQVSVGTMSVEVINLESVSLKIAGTNASDFELLCGTHSYTATDGITLDVTDGLGVDCSPTIPVQVRYKGDYASAVGKKAQVTITDGSGHTATVNVEIQSVETNEYGVPKSIYASMASTTGIETGTEHKTNNSHPYHIKRAVDLTGAFAAGAACFDKLYIFGVTKGYTSAEQTTETTTINKYSKTPCYVYTKNADHYDFEQCVDNMNSDTKSIGVNVSANGQKLYFTGWCPYASAGYLPSDIGVFHVKGGAGAKVDIYLDNCYLYPRNKMTNHSAGEEIMRANTNLNSYPTGSGGAFVFETTSERSDSPFTPYIHLRGENVLNSVQGNVVYVTIATVTKTATQCSSPIHMYTTNNTKQYETLTIDDQWPINAAGTNFEHTNGKLDLKKFTNNAPSIDLGNGNSVVNINGGQIKLQNSIPMSKNYTSTLAISWRMYSQSVLKIFGMGNDQASGTVNFNDGTISSTDISIANDYINYYWDAHSMKCPQNTTINGGSYNCNIYACNSCSDKGSSAKDRKGTALCKLEVPSTGTKTNGMAEFEFPLSKKNELGTTLQEYYREAGYLYGQNSITADENGNVNLMLPCSYIGEKEIIGKTAVPWAMCVPALNAGAASGSTALSKSFGGDITAQVDATHDVNNLLWTQIDENMEEVIGSGEYKSPEYNATVQFDNKAKNHYYSQITNPEEYSIQGELIIIIPAMADRWMTFTAPFDIQELYVLESYPDSILKEVTVGKGRNEALKLQATANVDLSYFLAYYVLGLDQMSTSPFSDLYNSWLSYEFGQDKSNGIYKSTDYSTYTKKYRGMRDLVPYIGTNAAKANFYAYEAGDTWQLSSDGFVKPDWKYVTIGSDNVVLKKGKSYSLLFPYCVGCWTEDEKIFGREYWDYWTGKLLILVGAGPQTINGKNAQSSLLSTTPAANMVSISGNSTFADMVSDNSNLWTYSNTIGDESFSKIGSKKETISPAVSFLINGIQSKAGFAPKRINIRTGAITYERDVNTTTGSVPTIAGGRTLIVNSVDGGLTVIPVVAQQVGIYGSAGQLIASDYMTDETTLSLPAGIYMVRGEKETAKVIVR